MSIIRKPKTGAQLQPALLTQVQGQLQWKTSFLDVLLYGLDHDVHQTLNILLPAGVKSLYTCI